MGMNAILKKLDKLIELLMVDREERKQEKELKESAENEARLVEYAKAKKKMLPTGGIYSSQGLEDKPIKSGGELLPFGLSTAEKELLRDFYER